MSIKNCLLFLCFSTVLQAQTPLSWTLLPGIPGGACHSTAYDPQTGTLFAVMVDGLYRSADEGEHWEKVLALGQGSLPYRHQYEVDARGGRVAVLRFEAGLLAPQLFYSENLGNTWESVALPAGTGSNAPILHRIALFGQWILLNFGDGEGVYYSVDKGHTWTEPAFFQSAVFSTASPSPPSLIRSANRLYLYSFFKIYYTDGDPEQWQELPLPPGVNNTDLRFANEEKVLIADASSGTYYATTNTGQTWAPVTLHPAVHTAGYWYGQKEDTLLTGAGPVFRAVFPFTTATPLNGLPTSEYEYIPFWTDHYLLGIHTQEGDDTGLYAFPGGGWYRIRTDSPAPSYTQANRGLPEGSVDQFFSSPKGMIALGPTGMFRYRETPKQWDTLWLPPDLPPRVSSLVAIEDTFWIVANAGILYKAVGEGAPFQQDLSYIVQLPSDVPLHRVELRDSVFYLFNPYRSLYSLDSARSWKPIEDPWSVDFYQNIVGADGHFLAIYRNPFGVLGCYMTHDWGGSWTYLSELKPDSEARIYYNEGRFYAFDDDYNKGLPFLWVSKDQGYTWEKAPGVLPPAPPYLGIAPPVLFARGAVLYFGQVQGNLYASGDFGNTWISLNGPGDNIPAVGLRCLGTHEGDLYMGTGSLGVWRAPALVRTQEPQYAQLTLRLYPNPAVDQLWIAAGAEASRSYAVFDALGRRVLQGQWHAGEPVWVGALPPGGYWVWLEGVGVGWFFRG